MRLRFHRAIRRWLEAEMSADGERRADAALGRVFRALPAPPVPDGFAAAVLRRAGLAPADLGRRLRAVVAVSCLLAATATLFAPGLLQALARALGPVLRPALLFDLAAGALTGLAQRATEGLKVWEVIARLGEIVTASLASPVWLAAFAAAILWSLAAFRALEALLLDKRRFHHAGS